MKEGTTPQSKESPENQNAAAEFDWNTGSPLSVIHRIGLRYSEKIDYLKSASIPFEERIRIANKHTKRRWEQDQSGITKPENE
jgi:hypothetical protein